MQKPQQVNLTATLKKNGTVPEQIVFVEKAEVFYAISTFLSKSKLPSHTNLRMYFLLFSIELQLKVRLLKNGITVEDLKKISHSLITLYDEYVRLNSLQTDFILQKMFEDINPEMFNKFRYYVDKSDVFGSKFNESDFTLLEDFYMKLSKC